MQPKPQILADSLQSLRVWRVWLFLGVQDVKARFRRSAVGPLDSAEHVPFRRWGRRSLRCHD